MKQADSIRNLSTKQDEMSAKQDEVSAKQDEVSVKHEEEFKSLNLLLKQILEKWWGI